MTRGAKIACFQPPLSVKLACVCLCGGVCLLIRGGGGGALVWGQIYFTPAPQYIYQRWLQHKFTQILRLVLIHLYPDACTKYRSFNGDLLFLHSWFKKNFFSIFNSQQISFQTNNQTQFSTESNTTLDEFFYKDTESWHLSCFNMCGHACMCAVAVYGLNNVPFLYWYVAVFCDKLAFCQIWFSLKHWVQSLAVSFL